MTKLLDWRRSDDPRDVIHLAVQGLAEGHLVAFPSDGHYVLVASGLRHNAVDKLASYIEANQAKTADQGSTQEVDNFDRPTPANGKMPSAWVLLRSIDELMDYSPSASPIVCRMGSRSWPGPLDLIVDGMNSSSLLTELATSTRNLLLEQESGSFGVSCPRHESIQQVMRLCSGPLIMCPAFTQNGAVGKASVETDNEFGYANSSADLTGHAALVIDVGPIERRGVSTVVAVHENRCEVVREGLMNSSHLKASTAYTIVLVCTGNTCRSPMAETLLRSKLSSIVESRFKESESREKSTPAPVVAKRLRRGEEDTETVDDEDDGCFRILSAGVSAMPGSPASIGAIKAMEARGLDLTQHQSRTVTQGMLERADLVLTMTANHRQAILSRWPHLASKIFGVAPSGYDISDPYGGSVEMYRACAEKIDKFLEAWVVKLDTDYVPIWTT